jgi:hypothetical protein
MALRRGHVVLLLTLGGVALLAVAWFAASKVHFVDPAPAIEVADRFFACLKRDDVAGAARLYAAGVPVEPGSNWRRVLGVLQAKCGPVTDATLQRTSVVPRDDDACHLLEYRTARRGHRPTERLVVCAKPGSPDPAIAGHEMTRLDTGRRISVGLTVREVGIGVGFP